MIGLDQSPRDPESHGGGVGKYLNKTGLSQQGRMGERPLDLLPIVSATPRLSYEDSSFETKIVAHLRSYSRGHDARKVSSLLTCNP